MSEEKKMSLDAEELTEVAGGDEPDVPDAPDPENDRECPKCGSKHVILREYGYLCMSCGYVWWN